LIHAAAGDHIASAQVAANLLRKRFHNVFLTALWNRVAILTGNGQNSHMSGNTAAGDQTHSGLENGFEKSVS
jgi:hypothetical protein